MAHYHADIRTKRIKNFAELLSRRVLGERIPLVAEHSRTQQAVPYAERTKLEYRPITEGEEWGRTWDSAWFRLTAAVPKEWAGRYVVARIDLGGECLVFDDQGCPKLGLTSGSVFDNSYNKDIYHMLPKASGSEKVELWVEAAANLLFGVQRSNTETLEDPSKLHGFHLAKIKALRLQCFDHDTWQLWIDVDVLLNLYRHLPDSSIRKERVLRGLNRAADVYEREGTAAARAALKPVFDVPADPATLTITGVGHAHIDTGWLWQVKESIRKSARTFSSQIGLIERYPGYVFGASQPQHYAFVKEHYPALYEKIKTAVKQGGWEVQGGMWVEADCNLISGESMVRQLVHGKHFFKREFGVEVDNLWLPDVFGYSGNLPQILTKAGCPYFLTQKLSWSKYNNFPHHTFKWRGIDGTEVLTHFPPDSDYNSSVYPERLLKAEREYKERGICSEAISVFGIGNGGGGPKEEHIERAQRAANLNGVPRYKMGTAKSVFESLEKYRNQLDTWTGELYLEAHRGVTTTQAQVKRLNRRLEERLLATEMIATAAGLEEYPLAELDAIWKKLLINQFHDILPGSSIHAVYETTEAELAQGLERCDALMAASAQKICKSDADAITLFNPSSTPFQGVVALPEGFAGATLEGKAVASQSEGGRTVARVEVPAQTFVTLKKASGAALAAAAPSQNLVLENELVRYEFDQNLRLTAGLDKQTGRALVPAGQPANRLSLYGDRPHEWDAWDVDEFYPEEHLEDARSDGKVERMDGPARSGLRAKFKLGQGSRIEQTVWLEPGSRRVDFETFVDWREDHRMLRVAFPTTMHTHEASFEIQYGYVRRPTACNTSWDAARFEVAGHRFADLSEPDFGIALLNDSKYGYKVYDHVLDLNLLRSPTDPDPIADRGEHRFTYSLLPHQGPLSHSDVLAHAAVLNQGVRVLSGAANERALLPVTCEGEGIELSVVKRAESENAVVVRAVELRGRRSTATLRARNSGARIVPTNLVEWVDDAKNASKGQVALSFTPFEIKTFKIYAS
jgi:alpha-mannosidase